MNYLDFQKIGKTVFPRYSPTTHQQYFQSYPFTYKSHHPESWNKEKKKNLPDFNLTLLSPISRKDTTSIKTAIGKRKHTHTTTTTLDPLTAVLWITSLNNQDLVNSLLKQWSPLRCTQAGSRRLKRSRQFVPLHGMSAGSLWHYSVCWPSPLNPWPFWLLGFPVQSGFCEPPDHEPC